MDREETRIREAYARRQGGLPGAYSFFNPAYILQVHERENELLAMLKRRHMSSLGEEKILEIGCGTGHWLRTFLQWGARPENVFGIDLLPERIEQARKLCPRGVFLECGNASGLPFPDASFDLVLQSTVFTSILDSAMKEKVAGEMLRVLKPRGAILWYDFSLSNPKNPDVRGVKRAEIQKLFPAVSIFLKRITLAPPLGRMVGPISPSIYRLLSVVKPLCTHYLGLLQKQ